MWVGDVAEVWTRPKRSLMTRNAGSCISSGRVTAKAVDLTPMAGARAEVIDLPRGRPGEVIVAINARDKRYFDAYLLDLETGELQLIEENPGNVDAWHVDSNGDIRACTAQVGTKTEIRARDSASGSFRTLATYTDEESPSVHGFSADGTYLYFSSGRDANAERLVKLDLKTILSTRFNPASPPAR